MPTFSTFHPLDITSRGCQGLGLLPRARLQALKVEEAQPSPRAPAVHASVSGGLHLLRALPWGRTHRWTQANWEMAGVMWGTEGGKETSWEAQAEAQVTRAQCLSPEAAINVFVHGLHLPSTPWSSGPASPPS